MINHVLNTRLMPALPRLRDGASYVRRRAAGRQSDRQAGATGVKRGAETLQAAHPLVDGEPLPPEDRVIARRPVIERLYRVQAPRLRRFFARRAAPQDAADMVHDSFARLATSQAADSGDVACSEAYLQTIAQNVLRNRARAAFHRTTAALPIDDELPHPTTDLLALLETRDELARVERALLKLSPRTREIFMAHRLGGATYAEIAARMGLSVKTVEWHMSKAIAWLHRACGPR